MNLCSEEFVKKIDKNLQEKCILELKSVFKKAMAKIFDRLIENFQYRLNFSLKSRYKIILNNNKE